jgi:hypothetical protein
MSVSKDPHSTQVESIHATEHSISNRTSRVEAARRRSIREQETCKEPKSIEEAFIRILPRDFPTVLRSLIILACLIDYVRTGNVTMLFTAYAMSTGTSNLPLVNALLPHKKGTVAENESE